MPQPRGVLSFGIRVHQRRLERQQMNERYKNYLKSVDWEHKRKEKRREHNRCGICAAENPLDVHHLSYRADLTAVEQLDLRVLCRRCHDLAHELMRAGTLTFTSTNHHHCFARTKAAVKRALGVSGVNLFKS